MAAHRRTKRRYFVYNILPDSHTVTKCTSETYLNKCLSCTLEHTPGAEKRFPSNQQCSEPCHICTQQVPRWIRDLLGKILLITTLKQQICTSVRVQNMSDFSIIILNISRTVIHVYILYVYVSWYAFKLQEKICFLLTNKNTFFLLKN